MDGGEPAVAGCASRKGDGGWVAGRRTAGRVRARGRLRLCLPPLREGDRLRTWGVAEDEPQDVEGHDI